MLVAILLLMIFFSPYKNHDGFEEKLILERIEIDVPVEKAYHYLGNSENAREWSSFVHHITPLNSEFYQDGTEGSIRRCFQYKNEEGKIWDEETVIVENNKRRRLRIFNLQGFSLTADHLLTEQVYLSVNDNKCQVALTLFFESGMNSWISTLKMYYSAYTVSSIFKANLENIKKLNEQ